MTIDGEAQELKKNLTVAKILCPYEHTICHETTKLISSSQSLNSHFLIDELSTEGFVYIKLEERVAECFTTKYRSHKKENVQYCVHKTAAKYLTVVQGTFLGEAESECCCGGALGEVESRAMLLTGNQVKKIYTIFIREGLLKRNNIRLVY